MMGESHEEVSGISPIFSLFPKFIDFQLHSRFSYLSGKALPGVYFDILCLSGASPLDVIRVFYSYFSFYVKESILCVKNRKFCVWSE